MCPSLNPPKATTTARTLQPACLCMPQLSQVSSQAAGKRRCLCQHRLCLPLAIGACQRRSSDAVHAAIWPGQQEVARW